MKTYEIAATRAARRVFRSAGIKESAVQVISVRHDYYYGCLAMVAPCNNPTIFTRRTRRMINSVAAGAIKAANWAAMSASHTNPKIIIDKQNWVNS